MTTTTSGSAEGPSAAGLREQGFATRREVMSDAFDAYLDARRIADDIGVAAMLFDGLSALTSSRLLRNSEA